MKEKNYEELERKAAELLKAATVHKDQWEVITPDVDSKCTASQEYNAYFEHLCKEFTKPGITIEEGRYVFAKWGNYGTDPGDVDYIEFEANGVRCMWAIPHGCDEKHLIIAVHGGGYTNGSIYSHRKGYAHLAKKAGCKMILIDYRRTPDVKWPTPLDDVVTVYKWLLDQGYKGENMAVAGDSCGGSVCLTLPLRCQKLGLPMLGALMPLSPWGDLEAITPSYNSEEASLDFLNKKEMVRTSGTIIEENGTDLHDPEIAPMYMESFAGLPPTYIQVGGWETFRDEARIMAGKMYEEGVDVKCEMVGHMQHSFQQLAGYCKDADQAIDRLAAWLKVKFGIK